MIRTNESPADARATPGHIRIRRLAEERLRSSLYPPLRRLTCEYHEGVLTVRGVVFTYYLKQLATAAVRPLAGVDEVNNQVRVAPVRSGADAEEAISPRLRVNRPAWLG